ncbi:hypothetical protein AMTR_s05696p00004940 [Amborella trichopoda]|uniref:phosphoserine transaminase n=1 Tax=Amborella trichopoda TaxID=13333 RepID=U5CYN2_AMBTC|nr:hypothetical protein AMTR_s05696p00004940 [Amborella trichopoda]
MSSNFCSKPVDISKFGVIYAGAQKNVGPSDLVAQGGLEAIAKKNLEKAWILYDAIDESGGFYRCPVEKSVRSLMNVPFTLEKSELEADFIKQAASQGMVSLKGHRSVGGVRASIYNAMPLAGVETLVPFMREFKAKHA